MIFVELFVPQGSLSAQERGELAERLMTDVSFEEPALPMVMETAIGNAEVVVHEPSAWSVAGSVADSSRFVVRVTVPSQWREDMGRQLSARLTRVLKGVTGMRADVSVQVVGIPLAGADEATLVGGR